MFLLECNKIVPNYPAVILCKLKLAQSVAPPECRIESSPSPLDLPVTKHNSHAYYS